MIPTRPAVEGLPTVDDQTVEGPLAAAPPLVLLAVVTWCVATRGGTGAFDLAVACVGLGVALVLTAGKAAGPRLTAPGSTALLFLALLAWLVVDGPLRSGVDLETVRVPVLCAAAYVTLGTIARLGRQQRALLVNGLIAIGVVHAVITLTASLGEAVSCSCMPSSRAASLVGSPNVLGAILVGTAALTARALDRHRTPALVAALSAELVAVLLTQSRLAVLTALVLVGWYWARAARRSRLVLLPWVVAAAVVLVVRFVQSMPDQRWYLWVAAVRRIADHPIAGNGPAPEVYLLPLARARLTTQAHNEILQFTADYGILGLALLVALLAVALRSLHRTEGLDAPLVAAAAAVLASGLTDFTLRVTAVTIMAAAMAGLAFLPLPEHQPRRRGATRGDRAQNPANA